MVSLECRVELVGRALTRRDQSFYMLLEDALILHEDRRVPSRCNERDYLGVIFDLLSLSE